MDIRTGETIYENFLSLDRDGNPLPSATFDTTFFVNGIINTDITLSVLLTDVDNAVFSSSFSSSTYGYHQYRIYNNLNRVVYMSDIYVVKPDNELPGGATIYVGI